MTDLMAAKLSGSGAVVSAAGGVMLAMTDAVSISIVTSVAAVVMAGMSAYFAHKAKVMASETHKVVNSRMDEFMEMAKKFFRNEGVLEEKAAQAERDKHKADKDKADRDTRL